MRYVINITIVLLSFISILFSQGIGIYSTNPSNESNGLAGIQTKLSRFNHNNSYKDISENKYRIYYTSYKDWYHSNMLPKTHFYNFHISKGFGNLGRLGVDLSYLDLGEQNRTNQFAEDLGSFSTYFTSIRTNYSGFISDNSAIGCAIQFTYFHLASLGAGAEKGQGTANVYTLDIGYSKFGIQRSLTLKRDITFLPQMFYIKQTGNDDGLSISFNILNMGDEIVFNDPNQGNPTPQRFTIGIDYKFFQSQLIRLNIIGELEKPLIAYNEEKEAWDPFWRALLTGWSNDSTEIEQKDIMTRVGAELHFTNFLTFRFGSYRYPFFDNPRYPKNYEYKLTWGFSIHYNYVSISGAFLKTDWSVPPWEKQFSIKFKF